MSCSFTPKDYRVAVMVIYFSMVLPLTYHNVDAKALMASLSANFDTFSVGSNLSVFYPYVT